MSGRAAAEGSQLAAEAVHPRLEFDQIIEDRLPRHLQDLAAGEGSTGTSLQ